LLPLLLLLLSSADWYSLAMLLPIRAPLLLLLLLLLLPFFAADSGLTAARVCAGTKLLLIGMYALAASFLLKSAKLS
jgi:hypothetical protein